MTKQSIQKRRQMGCPVPEVSCTPLVLKVLQGPDSEHSVVRTPATLLRQIHPPLGEQRRSHATARKANHEDQMHVQHHHHHHHFHAHHTHTPCFSSSSSPSPSNFSSSAMHIPQFRILNHAPSPIELLPLPPSPPFFQFLTILSAPTPSTNHIPQFRIVDRAPSSSCTPCTGYPNQVGTPMSPGRQSHGQRPWTGKYSHHKTTSIRPPPVPSPACGRCPQTPKLIGELLGGALSSQAERPQSQVECDVIKMDRISVD